MPIQYFIAGLKIHILALSADAMAVTSSYYGASRFLYSAYVGCSGSEERVVDCSLNPTAFTSCGDGEYAGVRCMGMCIHTDLFLAH